MGASGGTTTQNDQNSVPPGVWTQRSFSQVVPCGHQSTPPPSLPSPPSSPPLWLKRFHVCVAPSPCIPTRSTGPVIRLVVVPTVCTHVTVQRAIGHAHSNNNNNCPDWQFQVISPPSILSHACIQRRAHRRQYCSRVIEHLQRDIALVRVSRLTSTTKRKSFIEQCRGGHSLANHTA